MRISINEKSPYYAAWATEVTVELEGEINEYVPIIEADEETGMVVYYDYEMSTRQNGKQYARLIKGNADEPITVHRKYDSVKIIVPIHIEPLVQEWIADRE